MYFYSLQTYGNKHILYKLRELRIGGGNYMENLVMFLIGMIALGLALSFALPEFIDMILKFNTHVPDNYDYSYGYYGNKTLTGSNNNIRDQDRWAKWNKPDDIDISTIKRIL